MESGDAPSDDIKTAVGKTAVDETADVRIVETAEPAANTIDLDGIERDLADVEIALARLESGTYWTCEVTGQPLSDELLGAHPTARRVPTA